jgi:hypothetical protein
MAAGSTLSRATTTPRKVRSGTGLAWQIARIFRARRRLTSRLAVVDLITNTTTKLGRLSAATMRGARARPLGTVDIDAGRAQVP